ncbi:hypothetical protein [Bradyrhizobium sp.]|uniref:hypothetical protein n=1 Tax=Bradyrhizobium sp. TaxID=376 RepID=UPI002382D948|nr:hypothetical protein [Bradyrhizobium sp.]MDE2376297.1 hypothetical protein [Bradyrhizobium sp.]
MRAARIHSALIVFLVSYAVLTVLGNLLYFSSIGDIVGWYSIHDFSISKFTTAGSAGYWALLLLPFAIVPPVAMLVGTVLRPILSPVAARLPAPSLPEYLLLLLACHAYVAASLWRANAIGLMFGGASFVMSSQARLDLFSAIGFWPQVVLKSVLFALTCYGFVRALMGGGPRWIAVSAFNLIAMSIALALLNMKWPLVLLYCAHMVALWLLVRRSLVLPTVAFALLAGAGYVAVTFLVLHAVVIPSANGLDHPAIHKSDAAGIAASALLNRMAQPYPYYFETFTLSPGKCGTLLTRIRRKPSPCQPSNLVYAEMFSDAFAGVGTAPQPPHVTGYALNGWPGALVEIVLTAIVLGLFAAMAGAATAEQATLTVIGALTGYHFSQLPFEGPLVYDHGLLWLIPLLLAVMGAHAIRTRRSALPSLAKAGGE